MIEVLDLFGALLKSKEISEFRPFQMQAWTRLQEIGLPQKKEEAF